MNMDLVLRKLDVYKRQLDACWLYGDKEKISETYMQAIVMSTTYGEREAETTLANAWEILGGLPCDGLCGCLLYTSRCV